MMNIKIGKRNLLPTLLTAAAMICIVCIMHVIPMHLFESATIEGAFENLLHSIGFAGVAVIVYRWFNLIQWKNSRKQRYFPMSATLLVVAAMGSGAELLQTCFSKDANVTDLLRDIAGGLVALLLVEAFRYKQSSPGFNRLEGIAAVLIALGVAAPFIETLCIFGLRDLAGPKMFTFDRFWEQRFIEEKGATLTIVKQPENWAGHTGSKVAEVRFVSGPYPGIGLNEVYADWRRAETFQMTVFSTAPDTIPLHIRIDDRYHNNDYYDRFNAAFRIKNGVNLIVIPVDSIRNGLRNRKMDMRRIRQVIIFSNEVREPFSLYLDNIRLD